jgi:hypothetical protein
MVAPRRIESELEKSLTAPIAKRMCHQASGHSALFCALAPRPLELILNPRKEIVMYRLAAFLAAALLSAPLWATQCPADMAKIDAMLQSNPPSDPAVLAQVQQLRAEGEELHNAGDHGQSVQMLGEALQLLEASE